MVKIGEKIGEPICTLQIEMCHRVPAHKTASQRNTIVHLARHTKRDAILDIARKAKILGTHLGLYSANPVFINELLSQQPYPRAAGELRTHQFSE